MVGELYVNIILIYISHLTIILFIIQIDIFDEICDTFGEKDSRYL